MSHQCHANGCEAVDCHPELPFCKRHFNMLPELYRKLLWAGRRKDGVCGACDPRKADEVPLRADDRWFGLFNLSCAILIILERGIPDCDGHPEFCDAEGFCWGCGIFNADDTYEEAHRTIDRFLLDRFKYAE